MLEVLDSTGAEASKPRVSPRPESRLLVLPLVIELLALTLFVARVALANHHDVTVATNHSALLTDGLDAGVDLHCVSLSLSSIRPEGLSLLSSSRHPALLVAPNYL